MQQPLLPKHDSDVRAAAGEWAGKHVWWLLHCSLLQQAMPEAALEATFGCMQGVGSSTVGSSRSLSLIQQCCGSSKQPAIICGGSWVVREDLAPVL